MDATGALAVMITVMVTILATVESALSQHLFKRETLALSLLCLAVPFLRLLIYLN